MYTSVSRLNSPKRNIEQLVVLSVLAVLFGPVVLAQEDTNTPSMIEPNVPFRVALNFQDVPLQTVLEYLSETAGLVVVCDEPLNGRITVISRQPVGISEAISLINSVLKERDLAAVRTGRTLRVVTLAKAKTMNLPVTSGSDPDLITPADDIVTHVVSVRYLDAAKLKENLQSLIPEYASLQANQEGNALIITDTTANIKRLMEIIRALDTHMAGVSEIRVFHLQSADARNTADLINKLFQPEQQASSRTPQSPRDMMRMMMSRRGRGRDSEEEQQQTEGRAGARVVAAADDRTNSVVVSGPADTMGVVGQVIEALDSRSAAVADVKVFHLEYADAENTAQLINEVFGKDRSSSRSRSSSTDLPLSFRRGRFGSNDSQQTQESDRSGSIVEVVASADQRTNSIVVSGPPDTLEVIAQVIKELDANPEQERQIFVYALKNAEASNLKEILNNLFTEIQSLNQEGGGSSNQGFRGQTGRGQGQQAASRTTSQTPSEGDLSEEAYFEADDNTNSLLVMTSSKNYAKIKPIIDQLDRRLGQVLIKVLFAEITHSDDLDLGLEFSALNLRSGGDSTLFSTDFGIAAKTGGLVVKAVEGDLTATLRALQEVGKLNILSRPYILTRDNQTATITVGEEVPFITNTRTTETGQTINTIQYEDIGIILEVTPSINPEGLVIMDVKPEISTTTGKTVPISETVDAAVFAKRASQTRVEVRDGQTIVIGGLVEDQVSENVQKVPLLGDIPLVGLLFRRTVTEKSKTELLIFLTPFVAIDDERLTAISETEKARSTLEQGGFGADVFQKHMEGMKGTLDSKKP
ncbi:MAG TPA: secretin N-terminal domain-containing protein [Sedimentisphaerales bacterium]|nr:secretin N-terminal domain-containing protein [Sedimentisphaerales bacterium]